MKIGALRAIAHNIADSLGSGIGILIGVYDMNAFGEAKRSPGGIICIDFLSARATKGKVSRSLGAAIVKYRKVLPSLCGKHGASINDFKTLTASYSTERYNRRIVVTVQDRLGRRYMDEYIGTPASHVKVIDRLGRIRTSVAASGGSRVPLQRAATRKVQMKKTILTLSVLIASFISPVYAKSPNWELMFSTPDMGGPRTAWYVDRDSLSLQGGILTAWILLNFGHPVSQQMPDGKFQNFRSSKSLIYIDCATHRVATVEDKEYREPFGEGKSHTVVYGPKDPQSKRLRWEDPQIFRDADRESSLLCKQTRIAYSPVKDVAMTSRLDVQGVISQMEVSPARKNLLVAAATPNKIPGPGDAFGVYTFSIRNPETLQKIGFFPVLDADNLALSRDGLIAYALAPRRGGYPQDSKYYGLFVLDISDPEKPRLLAHVSGSFFSMGLSSDGNVLFLQELHAAWADHNEAESRIRAYRLRDGVPKEYCAVDFGTRERNSEIFAYSFSQFVDSPYLVISSRGAEAVVLNVGDPCKPITVGDVVSAERGIAAGWKNARILGRSHGLVSFEYTKPQSETRLYRSDFNFLSAVRVFDAGATVTAVGPNEVFVFDGEKDNCFHEARSFHVQGAADGVVGSDSMLYVGGRNFIGATRMTAGQVLEVKGACETEY